MKKMLTLCCLTMVFHLQAQEKTINKSFSNVKTIQLSTGSGNITIKKSQGAGVNVSITHSYDSDEFTPVIEQQSGKLIMKEKFSEGNHSGNSAWTIAVPDNVSLNLNSGSGAVTMAGVSTDVKSNLGSGNVSISSVRGELAFNTGSGDINLYDTQGDFAFNTGSGDIRADGGKGNFRLNAGSGDIDLVGSAERSIAILEALNLRARMSRSRGRANSIPDQAMQSSLCRGNLIIPSTLRADRETRNFASMEPRSGGRLS